MSVPRLAIPALAMLASTAIGLSALWDFRHPTVMLVMLGQVAIYGLGAWMILRPDAARDDRRVLAVVLGTALVCRVLIVFAPPVSTDIYRYIWDGRVQSAGINPYRYIPADPALERLRDAEIYPGINRAEYAPTIYPPMAQMIFLGIVQFGETVMTMKAGLAAFEVLTIVGLLLLLRTRGLPLNRVLLYAWHPLPLWEFAGSGHVDAAAVGLMTAAIVAADRKRQGLCGGLLAAAALIKYFPLVIAPALYRRWGWKMPTALIGVAAALYLPYLGVGAAALGFLPGYVQEEGLGSGEGIFFLTALGTVLPSPPAAAAVYALTCLGALGVIGWRAAFRPDRETVALQAAGVLIVLFTVAISPHHAWYFTWIVPFLCFRPSPALIWLTGAAPLLYGMVGGLEPLALNLVLYVPFALLLLFESASRAFASKPKDVIDGPVPNTAG